MDRDETLQDLVRRHAETLIRAHTLFWLIARGYDSPKGRVMMRDGGVGREEVDKIVDRFDEARALAMHTLTGLGGFTPDEIQERAADLDRQDAAVRRLAAQA